jgi:hypothetical protein
MSDEYDDYNNYDQDNWLEEYEQARNEYEAQNSEDEQDNGNFFIFGILSGFFDWLFK